MTIPSIAHSLVHAHRPLHRLALRRSSRWQDRRDRLHTASSFQRVQRLTNDQSHNFRPEIWRFGRFQLRSWRAGSESGSRKSFNHQDEKVAASAALSGNCSANRSASVRKLHQPAATSAPLVQVNRQAFVQAFAHEEVEHAIDVGRLFQVDQHLHPLSSNATSSSTISSASPACKPTPNGSMVFDASRTPRLCHGFVMQ